MTQYTQEARAREEAELRVLIEQATDEDLADGGRYWADSLSDLTQCPHGDMGRYDHAPDGVLIEWLWNRRSEIADLYAARHRETHDASSGGVRVPVEPTDEMIRAGADAMEGGPLWKNEARSVWSAMLAAAPPTSEAATADVLKTALERIANSERAAGIYDTLGNAAIARAALKETSHG